MKPDERQSLDATTFEQLFRELYQDLFFHACRFIYRRDIAEELVQDTFVKLWENRQKLHIQSSYKAYLFQAVRNQCLNYLKSNWHKMTDAETEIDALPLVAPAEEKDEALGLLLRKGIEQLPEKCRTIFLLSRQAGLTYDEIATELQVSKETVKSQIKIALQKLRNFLGAHWDTLVILLGQNFL